MGGTPIPPSEGTPPPLNSSPLELLRQSCSELRIQEVRSNKQRGSIVPRERREVAPPCVYTEGVLWHCPGLGMVGRAMIVRFNADCTYQHLS